MYQFLWVKYGIHRHRKGLSRTADSLMGKLLWIMNRMDYNCYFGKQHHPSKWHRNPRGGRTHSESMCLVLLLILSLSNVGVGEEKVVRVDPLGTLFIYIIFCLSTVEYFRAVLFIFHNLLKKIWKHLFSQSLTHSIDAPQNPLLPLKNQFLFRFSWTCSAII